MNKPMQRYDIEFNADDGTRKFHVKFSVYHNDLSNTEAAFHSWLNRTDEYTPESLVFYINSKSHMTLQTAMTEKEYNKLT